MVTEKPQHDRRPAPAGTIERNRRDTRWLHAGIYLATTVLVITGGWLWLGQEGHRSILAMLAHVSDVALHKIVGWVLAGLGVLGVLVWRRRILGFARETFRWDRGDLRWLLRWPIAVRSGRFDRHQGDFDPAQRGANVILVGGLILLIGSGLGLVLVHGGPLFVWFHRIHTWVSYPVTLMIVGHVVVASGLLPGYRGTWRAMHLGGRLPVSVARRLWPGWLERQRHDD